MCAIMRNINAFMYHTNFLFDSDDFDFFLTCLAFADVSFGLRLTCCAKNANRRAIKTT